ncbi:MAG TPA: recombinase family protein [Acidimicrobiia bacterium]|nr:recombinase family protein [Acidimicrobiia bacterium]
MKARRRLKVIPGRQDAATTRCAIYTRQSVEERTKSDFGSLQAQRDRGEAYIGLFAEKGWVALPTAYEDSGYSGGTLERPALKQLRADIAAGLVDAVIVYRSDRLSRSIRDFLELMEEFEHHGVAFVSVSEQFDTSTPGGRMHRNMLLTFAQYERELIAERTRDKVHAARRKGRFTGGSLPLGYDRHPDGGRLVVNPAEAERVRAIFELFLEKRSLVETVQELARRGWTLKRWTTKGGRTVGGGEFDVHGLRRLLTSGIYVGEVHFDGQVYPGEHEAVLDRELWDRVQSSIGGGATTGTRRRSTRPPKAPLAGLLQCVACNAAMSPSYSQKQGRRWRYYICHKAHRRGWSTCPSPSLPAHQIERFVVDRIRAIGTDPELVAATLEEARRLAGPDERVQAADLRKALAEFDAVWAAMTTPEQAEVAQELIERIDYDGRTKDINVVFRPEGVRMLAVQEVEA